MELLSGAISQKASQVLERAANVASAAGRMDQDAIDHAGALATMHGNALLGGGPGFVQYAKGDFNAKVLGGLQQNLAGRLAKVEQFADRRLPADEAERFRGMVSAVRDAVPTDVGATTATLSDAGVQLHQLAAQADVLGRSGSLVLGDAGLLRDVDPAALAAAAPRVGLPADAPAETIVRRLLASASSSIAHARPGFLDGLRAVHDPYGVSVAANAQLRHSIGLAGAASALDALHGALLPGSDAQVAVTGVRDGVRNLHRDLAIDGAELATKQLRGLARGLDGLWSDAGGARRALEGSAAAGTGTGAPAAGTTGAAVLTDAASASSVAGVAASGLAEADAAWTAARTATDAATSAIARGADPATRGLRATLPADELRDAATQVESLRDDARGRGASATAGLLDGVLDRLYPQVVRAREWKPGVIHEGRTPQHAELGRLRSDIDTARMVDSMERQQAAELADVADEI